MIWLDMRSHHIKPALSLPTNLGCPEEVACEDRIPAGAPLSNAPKQASQPAAAVTARKTPRQREQNTPTSSERVDLE